MHKNFLAEFTGMCAFVFIGSGAIIMVQHTANPAGLLQVALAHGLILSLMVTAFWSVSGGHINPAVTLGLVANGATEFGNPAFGTTVPVDALSVVTYIGAQLLGAFLGATVAWLAYKQHFDAEPDAGTKLAVFSTGPAIRSYGWNLVTEIIGTFVLVFVVIGFGRNGDGSGLASLGALPVALLVVGIGASLGGPTGYAINPARDLGPRIAHAVLPIKDKGASDWGYSWVPVVGPIIGGVLAGLAATPLLPLLG